MAAPTVIVSVIGLSRLDGENYSAHQGIGKSCLCYRFMYPGYDDYVETHHSLLALHEFESDVVHRDNFLYWGCTTKDYDTRGSSEKVHFHVLEHTVFYQDITEAPFETKKRVSTVEGYIKAAQRRETLDSPGKISYKNRDLICLPEEYDSMVLPPGIAKHPRGYVVVIDVSESGPNFDRRLQATEKVVAYLTKHKERFLLAATKRDAAFTTSLDKVGDLARAGKYTLVECSAKSNVNVCETFELVAGKVLKKSAPAISSAHALAYQEAALKTLTNRDKARRQFRSYLQKRVVLASERLKSIECTEEYRACTLMHGKFETDKLFTEHVLSVRNVEINSYAGVMDNPDMRQEFLEDYIADRTDLALYSNYLKDLIVKICQRCSDQSPPPPSQSLPPLTYTNQPERKDSLTSYQTFLRSPPLVPPVLPTIGPLDPPNQGEVESAVTNGDAAQEQREDEDDGQQDYVAVSNDELMDGESSDEYEQMARHPDGSTEEESDDQHDYENTAGIVPSLGPPAAKAEGLSLVVQQSRSTEGSAPPLLEPSSGARGGGVARGQPAEASGGQSGTANSVGLSSPTRGPPPPVKAKPKTSQRGFSLNEQPAQQDNHETNRPPDPVTSGPDMVGSTSASSGLGSYTRSEGDAASTEPKPAHTPVPERKGLLKQIAVLEGSGFQLQRCPERANPPTPEPLSVTPTAGGTAPVENADSTSKPRLAEIRKRVAAKYEQTVICTAPPTATVASPPVMTPTSPRSAPFAPLFIPVNSASPVTIAAPPTISPALGVPASRSFQEPDTRDYPPPQLSVSPAVSKRTEPSLRLPAVPPVRPMEVSAPVPQLTIVQTSSPLPSREESPPSSPPPQLPERSEECLVPGGSEGGGENMPLTPKASRIKRFYELVSKKKKSKSDDTEEPAFRPQTTEPSPERTRFEAPRKTFIDMSRRPLPPEPGLDDSDDDLKHDYEKVEDGGVACGWTGKTVPAPSTVRRAHSFNAVDKSEDDYENTEERPRPPDPSTGCDDEKLDYDYPTVRTPFSKKPAPPRRPKPANVKMSSSFQDSRVPTDGWNKGIHDNDDVDDDDGGAGTHDDSYVNWDPQASLPSTRHSQSAEDLSVYMNLPIPDPAPSKPAKTAPTPPVKPRKASGTLPRVGLDNVNSSSAARPQGRAPGVVTKPLPPRNIMRKQDKPSEQ